MTKYSYEDEKLKALLRSAFIGLISTVVSDTISNSIRVVKTFKQTAHDKMTYKEVITQVVEKDGLSGLFLRGLQTKILTNVLQGVTFRVAWKYLEWKFAKPK